MLPFQPPDNSATIYVSHDTATYLNNSALKKALVYPSPFYTTMLSTDSGIDLSGHIQEAAIFSTMNDPAVTFSDSPIQTRTATQILAEAKPPPPVRRENAIDPRGFPSVIPPDHNNRTVIVCFDGTGDQFDADNSNIVQFVQLLKKDDNTKQLVYYQVCGVIPVSHGTFLVDYWRKCYRFSQELGRIRQCRSLRR